MEIKTTDLFRLHNHEHFEPPHHIIQHNNRRRSSKHIVNCFYLTGIKNQSNQKHLKKNRKFATPELLICSVAIIGYLQNNLYELLTKSVCMPTHTLSKNERKH